MTAPTPRGLLDTQIVIDYRDAVQEAIDLFAAIKLGGQPEFSEITAMALTNWNRDAADQSGTRWLLADCTVLRITAKISQRAYQILDRLPPPAALSPAEAIIAATALAHKLPLYTLDPGRFAAVPGLAAARPY